MRFLISSFFLFSILACGGKLSSKKIKTTLVNIDKKYSVSIPAFLSKTAQLNEDASLQYQNIYKEFYFIVIDESKEEFIKIVRDAELYDEEASPLRNFSIVQMHSVGASMTLKGKMQPKINNFRGLAVEQTEFYAILDDIELFYLLSLVEGKNSMYTLISWTLASYEENYRQIMYDTHASFIEH